jgi:hypothetical protein
MTNITIELPDELARQAQDAGLLMPEQIIMLLRTALMRQTAVTQLQGITMQLMALDDALTEEEVETELKTYKINKLMLQKSS